MKRTVGDFKYYPPSETANADITLIYPTLLKEHTGSTPQAPLHIFSKWSSPGDYYYYRTSDKN